MQEKQQVASQPAYDEIAQCFVDARQSGKPLHAYPGATPQSLEASYAIQDAAIRRWPDRIGGWKVGRIPEPDATHFGVNRLAGPIFAKFIQPASDTFEVQIFSDGFAAVESEVILVLSEDAPPEKKDWTAEEARALIGAVRAGAEIASSPFAGINSNGPLVTISDFGNNSGLLLGEELPDWRDFQITDWRCETFIDGVSVGADDPSSIPGGPIESLRFLLELCGRRGLPLKKGMYVSSGAITGVHEIRSGQTARITFNGVSPINCRMTKFSPRDPAQQ